MSFLEDHRRSWDQIRDQFQALRGENLFPFHASTAEDLERYYLSVFSSGAIESPFLHKINSGEWVYSVDDQERSVLQCIAFELGFTKTLPEFVPNFYRPPFPIDWELLESSVDRELATPEFVLEWGRLQGSRRTACRLLCTLHGSNRR